MRKSLVGFVVVGICLAFSCIPAHAQTSITLLGGSGVCTSCIDFTVSGSSVTLTMSTFTGTAVASGTQVPSPIPMFTAFTLSESSPIKLMGSGGSYTVAPGSGTFDITLKEGLFTLIGVLTIQNLQVTDNKGVINTTIEGNFSITGGTYCGDAGSTCGTGVGSGTVLITLSMACGSSNITNGCHAGIDSLSLTLPATDLANTPEPSSMLLFGTGLLACGVFLRRRLS